MQPALKVEPTSAASAQASGMAKQAASIREASSMTEQSVQGSATDRMFSHRPEAVAAPRERNTNAATAGRHAQVGGPQTMEVASAVGRPVPGRSGNSAQAMKSQKKARRNGPRASWDPLTTGALALLAPLMLLSCFAFFRRYGVVHQHLRAKGVGVTDRTLSEPPPGH